MNQTESLSKDLQAYMEASASIEQFSGAVLVVLNGAKILSTAYGMACYEHMVPNKPSTRFRLGSITKPLTAMCVYKLRDEGRLALEKSPQEYIEGLPEHFSRIKIEHLLAHSSGLANFTEFPDYTKTQRLYSSPLDTIARFKDLPLLVEPGKLVRYNNSGYILLGAIIEAVSGRSYADYVLGQIFAPLQMNASGYDSAELVISERAHGYIRQKNLLENAPYLDMSIPFAAGALYSTIEDLYLLDQAISGRHAVLPGEVFELMQNGASDGYSRGFHVSNSDGRFKVGHSGGIDGFCTIWQRYPHQGLSIIILSNVVSWSYSPERIAHDLASICFGEPYEVPRLHRAIKLDPDKYDDYQGDYELDNNTSIRIRKAGEKWLAQFNGRENFEIFPESESEFFVSEFDAQIKICLDENAKVSHILLQHEGQCSRAVKLNS